MSGITHHIPEDLLVSYAAGNLSHPYALVVAAHVSLCLDCRAFLEAHNMAGGVVLEETATKALSSGLKSSVLDALDEPVREAPVFERKGIYPGPVMQALKGKPPRWKSLGMGVRQSILSSGAEGSLRLLYIPQGRAVPEHSHNGLELTLVLQGSFSDEAGRFGVGDLEVADQSVDHTPIADEGAPCICLAATDAPLRFNTFVPRLLQPLFKI